MEGNFYILAVYIVVLYGNVYKWWYNDGISLDANSV